MILEKAKIIELENVTLPDVAKKLLQKQIAAKGSESEYFKKYPMYDWQRLAYALKKIRPGERCLEIGPGRGYLTTLIYRSKLFDEMHAIDIVDRSKRIPASVNFKVMDVASLSYPDNYFDTVICMEVLEHLNDEAYYSALSEIRRVCKKYLIATMPFNEPMPSKYHYQKLTMSRVNEEFQNAHLSLLLKKPIMRVPWMMLEETVSNSDSDESTRS